MNFKYEWINEKNLNNKELPKIKDFYSSINLGTISEEEYNQTKEIYDKLQFKNVKNYLDTYLKSDITLLCDIFENFRKGIWDKFYEKYEKRRISKYTKNNSDIFGCKIGLMEDEIDKNDEIIEYIGLSSKFYSYITKENTKK